MKPSKPIDGVLLLSILGLTLFGFIMVTSASQVLATQLRGDTYFFLKHQLTFGGGVGLVGLIVGLLVPYYRWKMLAFPALGLSLVLLIMVFIPGLQVESGGAARWIGIGPLTFQPTEFTKLAFILYMAALLETKSEHVRSFRQGVVPFAIIMSIIAILIVLQPDIGTLMSIVVIGSAMGFAAGFRLRHLGFLGLAAAAAFLVLVNMASYRLNRIITYLHPELDPKGLGYQINQALLAVGSGGLWGLGLGKSRQKYHYLPEPAGDSIFAITAEELGFVRIMLVLSVFVVIAWKGYGIAAKAPDKFGQLLAVGITTWIVSQAFINMASIMALLPLTGIPLPFISYGGSSLVTMLFGAGVLLNISRYTSD